MPSQSLLSELDWITLLRDYAYNLRSGHVAHATVQASSQVDNYTKCVLQELHVWKRACCAAHKLAIGPGWWASAKCYCNTA